MLAKRDRAVEAPDAEPDKMKRRLGGVPSTRPTSPRRGSSTEHVPEAGAARDLEQLLAAGARDPEVLSQALAALPADQRETFEAQLKAAGVM